MKRIFDFIYQWLIFAPIFILITFVTAVTVMLFSSVFGNKCWGYYPPKIWSRLTCWLALCRINTSGHRHLNPKQSYIFIANHQGGFDIFLVYGFLNQNIKWVQKKSLRKLPFVGKASEIAGHVFVDHKSMASRRDSIVKAEKEIVNGVSMMLFPEGSRTLDGKMNRFKRGAFQIALDMKLPIVPLTINGSYNILKRHARLIRFRQPLELTIHPPIATENLTDKDIPDLMQKTKAIIESAVWER